MLISFVFSIGYIIFLAWLSIAIHSCKMRKDHKRLSCKKGF